MLERKALLFLPISACADLTEHLSHAENYNEGFFQREGYHVQESASFLQNMAENWGQQYGLNAKESMEGLASASVGGEAGFLRWFSISARATGSYGVGASRDEMCNSALARTQNEQFQKHFQKINEFAESKNYSDLKDEGVRYATNYSHATDVMQSSQASQQVARSQLDQISDNASWLKQNSQLIKQSLNQDFVNWAQCRYAHQGGFSRVEEVFAQGSEADKQNLAREFITDLRKDKVAVSFWDESKHSPIEKIDSGTATNWLTIQSQELKQQGFGSSFAKGDVIKEQGALSYSQAKTGSQDDLDKLFYKMRFQRDEAAYQFDDKNDQYLIGRAYDHLWHKKNLSDNYRLKEEPFWLKDES